jgi:ribosomal protein S15P/S13E
MRRRQHRTDLRCQGTSECDETTEVFSPMSLVLHNNRSPCQPIALLLDTKHRLKESLSGTGEEEQVKLLLNQFNRLKEHVSGTSR